MRSNLLLLVAAFIWGTAFVAQSVGMDYIEPFTFSMTRFTIGGIVLLPVVAVMVKNEERHLGQEAARERFKAGIKGGIACGFILFAASSFQQVGITMTTVSKSGFITALYIVLVPILGIFVKKKAPISVWIGVVLATVGMYLLCITEGLHINPGDLLVFLCAICFAFHILVVDHVSPGANGVLISSVQFLVTGILASIPAFCFEKPQMTSILMAWQPILYTGFLSCGIAYTLQIVAQKDTDPTVASLLMSLESVFSLLAGWIILGQSLSARELFGCVLMFGAVILAQVPVGSKEK